MHKLKEKLMEELYELEERLGKASGKMSSSDLEMVHKLTDTVKNIDKIEMLEEGGGYSEESNWMADGRMYGTSYEGGSSYRRGDGRGRGRNARRDSMGRYAREGMSYEDGRSYEGGSSYARGNQMGNRGGTGTQQGGGYSRGGAKEYMAEQIEEMMEEADSPEVREALKRCKKAIENA